MELNTQQISAENRSVESMMLTWPECFYKEKEAEMRFALLEEAQRQELTPEENGTRRFLLAHRYPGYPGETPLTDHFLKLWFFLIFAADGAHGKKASKRDAKAVADLVKELGLASLQSETDRHLLYREFFHTALLYINISLSDRRYSSIFLNLGKLSDEKLKQKVAKDLYKAGVLGPDAVGFANDDLWRSALKDAFHSYFPGSEDVWESLKK
ncbi:MAG: hypothetical protein IJJ24_10445 [Solobacterium sp.]|nr:hypothetical protein [Solobacterium sp.]